MKSWIELSEDKKEEYIKEFRKIYRGTSSVLLHKFNLLLIVLIFPLGLIVVTRTLVGTINESLSLVLFLILFLLIYFFNISKIKTENKEFSKWLKSKNVVK